MITAVRAWTVRLFAIALILLVIQGALGAHDVPDQIDMQAYVRPSGSQLQVILRVPLLAITDINLPKDSTGYLAMAYMDPALRDAANQIATGIVFMENDERLSQFQMANARISIPSDKSFASYDEALAHVRGAKLPNDTQLYYNQGYVDLELSYPITSDQSAFAVQTIFGRGLANHTVTVVTFIRPDGARRVFHLQDNTDVIHLDPSAGEAMRVFMSAGFFRFLDGLDHLIFIIVLALPYRRVRDLVIPIGAFAVAHTLTLVAAALGFTPAGAWFPAFIGVLIAFSIVYVAIEDAIGAGLRHRWIVAFSFGLVHGFGFAFAFRDALQLAGGHPLAALLSFNVGLELGQIIILSIAVPAFTLLFTLVVAERVGVMVAAVLAGHAAWHWMADRFAQLQLTSWPGFDLVGVLSVIRWLLMFVIAGGVVWWLMDSVRRRPGERPQPEEKSILDRPA